MRVLVVEDDTSLATALEESLTAQGLAVDRAPIAGVPASGKTAHGGAGTAGPPGAE